MINKSCKKLDDLAPYFYTIGVSCSNCDFSEAVKISKGVQVNNEPCPVCGCMTLYKDETFKE